MQYQIEKEGVWTNINKNALQDNQDYRIKIPVGNDFGYQYGTYRTPVLADAKLKRIAKIKVEANERITALYWQLQKANEQHTRGVGNGNHGNPNTQNSLNSVLDARQTIRNDSDDAEDAVDLLTEINDVINFTW